MVGVVDVDGFSPIGCEVGVVRLSDFEVRGDVVGRSSVRSGRCGDGVGVFLR